MRASLLVLGCALWACGGAADDAGDSTATADAEGSETQSETETETETETGSETGMASDADPYSPCDQCINGEPYFFFPPLFQLNPDYCACSIECTSDDDCPDPVSGAPQATCVSQLFATDLQCMLECSSEGTPAECPGGMTCVRLNPSSGTDMRTVCGWPE